MNAALHPFVVSLLREIRQAAARLLDSFFDKIPDRSVDDLPLPGIKQPHVHNLCLDSRPPDSGVPLQKRDFGSCPGSSKRCPDPGWTSAHDHHVIDGLFPAGNQQANHEGDQPCSFDQTTHFSSLAIMGSRSLSAGSQQTESSSSAPSHLAASCSLR